MKKFLVLTAALMGSAVSGYAESNNINYTSEGVRNDFSARQYGFSNTIGSTGSGPYYNYRYYSSYGAAEQYGDGNSAEIRQRGLGNIASFQQGGVRSYYPSWYRYGRLADGNYNDLEIDQYGFYNIVKVEQFGDYNDVDLKQSGFYNVSEIEQLGRGDRVTGTQSGYGNYAEVYQGMERYGSRYRLVNYIQRGDDNILSTDQSFGYSRRNLGAQYITARQYGDDNLVEISQVGANRVYSYQSGDENTVSVTQNLTSYSYYRSYSHDAEVYQYGDDNYARIYQTEGYSGGHDAVVSQDGDNNYVTVSQRSSNASLALSQEGDRNRAYVSQSGRGNTATVSMYGDRGNVRVLQY